ncbi:MAG: hypothetical protein AB1705_00170 [Verrucomicrobiota bacterium]
MWAQTDPSPDHATVSQAVDVVKVWQAHQRLYVAGNIGVSSARLDELERWLDSNAKNWTVVLVESARGEFYRDSEGSSFYLVDAVEHALGKGLSNETPFGLLTDPRTQEKNGAVFVLFLKDRQFSYFGSDVYDNRGLGEKHFKNMLDRPAIAAMRGGGRIVDAVKDTIIDIDKRLAQRIQNEIESREKAARETRTTLASAGEALRLLERKSADLKESKPHLYGDLAEPGVPQFRGELASAEAIAASDPVKALGTAKRVRERCEQLIKGIEQYPGDVVRFDSLGQRLERQSKAKYAGAASREIQSARAALQAAQEEYKKGNYAYAPQLQAAETAVIAVERAVASAVRGAQLARNAGIGAGFGVLILIGAVGWGFNRRRLPVKLEALKLLKTWEEALALKNGALVELLDRRLTVVGSSREEIKSQFTGETLQLAEQVVKDVDALFIMTACADRVLHEARKLCEPSGSSSQLTNLFGARNFRAAIHRLSEEPITFKPEEALEFAIKGTRQTHSGLAGERAAQAGFSMSFIHLMREFEQRAKRSVAALDEIESSLVNVETTINASRKVIAGIAEQEASLSQTAQTPCFGVPALFADVLPAIGEELDKASEVGVRDPVAAVRNLVPEAQRKTEEAKALADLAITARQQILPKLVETTQLLRATGLSAAWPEQEFALMSRQTDDLLPTLLQRTVNVEIQALRQRLERLSERIHETLELEKTRRELALPAIQRAVSGIESIRADIASRLSLRAQDALREPGAEPSELMQRAAAEAESARLALDRGDTGAARNALDMANQLTGEANAMVDATRKAFEEHELLAKKLRTETARIEALLPEHARILRVIQENYAASVLPLGSGDPAHPNANGTIADNLQEAKSSLDRANALTDEAVGEFRAAQILKAADQLRRVQGLHEFALFRLQEIADKEKRLGDAVTANGRSLAELDNDARQLSTTVDDARTMNATVSAFAQAKAQLEAARAAMAAHPSDPFEAADLLARVGEAFKEIDTMARNDRDIFAEAESSVRAAQGQLSAAQSLAAQAASDNVLDSAAILTARRELQALEPRLIVAQQTLKQSHANWEDLDQEADAITADAGRHAATLRGEMQAAESAMRVISDAAQFVRSASVWRGGYSVKIVGSPGGNRLQDARHALSVADYHQALALAEAARREAASAIASAEAEVRRQKRLEEEREEAERRARRAAESRRRSSWDSDSSSSRGGGSSSNWGGGGGSSSSSSWGSSGSGFGSSSSSSGSGFGRSGW